MPRTPAQNEVEEAEEVRRAESGLQQALEVMRGMQVVLDTNILYIMFGNKKTARKAVNQIIARSTPILCDTVFWEFLRRCSLKEYRERSDLLFNEHLTSIQHGKAKETYPTLWLLYLYVLKRDPRRMMAIDVPDLWIAAYSVQNNIDNILTENGKHFPEGLFDDKEFYIGDDVTLHLKTFNRKKANIHLHLMQQQGNITISTNDLGKAL